MSEEFGRENERDTVDPARWLDAYGDLLYRYAMSRLREPEAAEEVVQETFVAGLRNIAQFSGRGAESAWLLGILKRKIIDLIRKRSRAAFGQEADSADELSERLFDSRGKWRHDPRIFGTDPSARIEAADFWAMLDSNIPQMHGKTSASVESWPKSQPNSTYRDFGRRSKTSIEHSLSPCWQVALRRPGRKKLSERGAPHDRIAGKRILPPREQCGAECGADCRMTPVPGAEP